jgi:hypothetical protein
MFYCSNCSTKIEKESNFCSSCGFDLRQESEKEQGSNIENRMKDLAQINPGMNQKIKGSYLLISFILLFGGLGLLFFQINEYFNTQDAISTLEKKKYPIRFGSSGQKEADIAAVRSTLSTTMLLMALGVGSIISSFIGFSKSKK